MKIRLICPDWNPQRCRLVNAETGEDLHLPITRFSIDIDPNDPLRRYSPIKASVEILIHGFEFPPMTLTEKDASRFDKGDA